MSVKDDTPVTVGMLIQAILASRDFITVPGGGGNGYDSSIAVVVVDEFIAALRQHDK